MSWLSDLLGGKKQDQNIYYTQSPQTKEMYDRLRGLTYEEIWPKYETMAKQTWQDQLLQPIREEYQAKRGMWSGTPEFAEEARQSRNLTTSAMGQASQDWMGIQQLLAGLAGQSQPYQQGQQQNPLAGLLTGAGGLAGNIFSNYMRMKALKDVFGGASGGGAGKQVSPTGYEDFFANPYGQNYSDVTGR